MLSFTLQPIVYVLEGVDTKGIVLQKEIPFSIVNVMKDFEEVFLHNAIVVLGNPNMVRMN